MSVSDKQNLIEKIEEKKKNEQVFFSFEFFPPKNEKKIKTLIKCISILNETKPLFIDVTWRLFSEKSSINIATLTQNQLAIETVLHLTCFPYSPQSLLEYLHELKKIGVKTILALKGDLPPKLNPNHIPVFKYAVDFVKFIRSNFGQYFNIGVAGYPNGHPESSSFSQELSYLKAKVDAGANFIITQLFFQVSEFKKFVNACREIGITVPIIPGIFSIQTKDSLQHVFKLTQVEAPAFIKDAILALNDDKEAIRDYGINHSVQLCQDILKEKLAPGLHFYTFNKSDSVMEILKRLNLLKTTSLGFENRLLQIDQTLQNKDNKFNKID